MQTEKNEYRPTNAQKRLRRLIASEAAHIMAFGGSRSGKTFELCRTLLLLALIAGGRYAIFRQHFNSVRTSVFMDTIPTVLKICFSGQSVILNKSDTYFLCPATGGEIWGLGLDDKERVDKILGKEFTAIYFNECSEISFHAIETAMTRVSQKTNGIRRNKIFYDCNPPTKNHWTYKLFIQKVHPETRLALPNPDDYVSIKINPEDNLENLPKDYINQTLGNLSTQKRKRFLLGEWTDDNENALWKMSSMIDPFRITSIPNDLERIVVGVDPAVTSSENSDHTGIVVAGKRLENDGLNHFYVLDDRSLIASPKVWASEVVKAFRRWNADKIVVETNQGGDLVVSTLRNINSDIPIKSVHATRGKIVRAEPIAAFYEQGRVHHVGEFQELEEEMTSFTGAVGEKSSDRMDALVWALTELSEENSVTGGNLWFG